MTSTYAPRTARGAVWHRIARTSGHARISAGGIEKDVTVEDADVGDRRVDAAYREQVRPPVLVDSITEPITAQPRSD